MMNRNILLLHARKNYFFMNLYFYNAFVGGWILEFLYYFVNAK